MDCKEIRASAGPGSAETVQCYCDTDLCNPAAVLRHQASSLIAVLFAVFILLAKAFACPIFGY